MNRRYCSAKSRIRVFFLRIAVYLLSAEVLTAPYRDSSLRPRRATVRSVRNPINPRQIRPTKIQSVRKNNLEFQIRYPTPSFEAIISAPMIAMNDVPIASLTPVNM